MRELKELLCEGERVYELTRCASSSVYFIGPETDDINHMDVSGALEDTLHRMVDAGFTEEKLQNIYVRIRILMQWMMMTVITLIWIMSFMIFIQCQSLIQVFITKNHGILIQCISLTPLSAKNLVIKDDATDDEILEAMQEKLGINPEEFIINDVRGDGTLIGI